jgi:cobalt-zinc-cadmium efflux system membrane fusion protein
MSRLNMKTRTTFIQLLPVLVLFAACGGNKDAAGTGDEHGHEHGEGTVVELSAEQVKAIGLTTGPLEHRNLTSTLKANGRLALPPQNEAQVSVVIGGTVSRIAVREGEHVQRGAALVEVASPEFLQLQQDFLEADAELGMRRADLARQRALRGDSINAVRTVQEAEAAFKSAEARRAGMAEKLRLLGVDPSTLTAAGIRGSFTLRAPITGNLHHISVTMGQYVQPGQPVLSITDNSALHIDLTVFEQDISKVHTGQKVTFSIANDPHGTHDAEIFGVNQAFEQGQQAIVVHARMDNTEDRLLPGMFIDARIHVSEDSTLCVPSPAIVSNGDDHYIYVEQEPRHFRQVQVATGTTDQGYTAIRPLEALPPDAKVVLQGAYSLLSELTKGSGEHHH